MNSDYVAWNGERYVWPPPEGWYLASDGRWWAPDTGPDADLEPSSDASPAVVRTLNDSGQVPQLFPDPGADSEVGQVDATAAPSATEPTYSEPTLTRPISTEPASTQPANAAEPSHMAASLEATGPPVESQITPSFDPRTTAGPHTGQVAAVSDQDATTAMSAEAFDNSRAPTMVMTEPQRTGTGQHPVVAPDPDTGRHDRVPILEPAEETPSGTQRSRTMPMVAAGLLAAAAIVIVALLALLGGDNETQTQQPSASAEETEEDSGGLVVSTDDPATSTTGDAMSDGAMDDGAMDDGAMDDGAMDDGAMDDGDASQTDQNQESTTTTVVDTESAALIGQFRTLLEDNQITAAALTGDDLVAFGQTACGYATPAADLAEYEQVRNEALNGAQNDELSIDELQFVVDTAVTVFCAEDATRLGLVATAPEATDG